MKMLLSIGQVLNIVLVFTILVLASGCRSLLPPCAKKKSEVRGHCKAQSGDCLASHEKDVSKF